MQKTNLFRWTLGVAVLAAVIAPSRPAYTSAQDSGNRLAFEGKNAVYEAAGTFQSWRITKADIPGGNLEKGVVELTVDLASVSEKSEDLAAHLRTNDFFDVAKFTTAKVTIQNARPTGDKTYAATATVDLHGIKRDVPVTFRVVSESPLKIDGEATLRRTDFGIGSPYDSKDELSVQEDIRILLSATLPTTS